MARSAYSVFSTFVISALLLFPGWGAHPGRVLTVGATFTVNSPVDLPDSDVGDGVCNTSIGKCTLRAAIDQANFTAGADTIILPAGVFLLTRPGLDDVNVLGDLDISQSLTIQGAGSGATIVDGNGAVTGDRVFQILSSAVNTTISGLTVRNGKRTATFDEGGGIYWDGSGNSHLTLTNVVVRNNAGYYGGGIYLNYYTSGDVVDLGHVTVHGNTATASAGGIGVSFGDYATFNLHDSQVDTNSAYEGGGVYFQGAAGTITGFFTSIVHTLIFANTASLSAGFENHSGNAAFPVLLQNSKIYQNHATGYGGGIGNYGNLTVANTTLDANTATTKGGGLYDYEGGVVNINQSTVSRNTSTTGGGIYTELFIHNASAVTLTNSTVSSNSASHDGAGIYADGGQVNSFNTTISANQILVPAGVIYAGVGGGIYKSANVGFSLENTLVADNTHRYATAPAVPDDCYGLVVTLGYNLIEDTANCTIFGTAPGNIYGQDPKLGPLQNSNGSTLVQVPLIGSPAINAGEVPSCTDANSAAIVIDERGVLRPESGRCDIGAVENLPFTEFMPELRK